MSTSREHDDDAAAFDDAADDDAALTYRALDGYANWVETGDFLLSARDAAERDKPYAALSVEQMRLVVRLRDLASATLAAASRGKEG